MKHLILLISIIVSIVGCIAKSKNSTPKNTILDSSSKSLQATSIVTGKSNAIGTNSGVAQKTLPNSGTDTAIEFKNSSAGGNMVCKFPSGICRTDADEGSGGASAYGDIPNSSASFIHYMKFRLYSNGFFSKNPDAHIAFGLRGKRMSIEEYGPNAGLDGRGIIIGNIGAGYFYNKNNIACVNRMAQVESYYRSAFTAKKTTYANLIAPTTCSDTIFEDYKWYSVEIKVTSTQYIVYKIYDGENKLIYKTYYYDSPNYVDPNLTGWFIGHVFGNPKTEWTLKLDNFEVGHIVAKDDFYPVKDFTSSLSLSTRYGLADGQNAHDFSMNLDKATPSHIKLNNVYGRSRIFSCAARRATLNGADNIDCNKNENYQTINFSDKSTWVFSNGSLSLNESFLQGMPEGYYSLYFRTNPQDVLSQVSLSFSFSMVACKKGKFQNEFGRTVEFSCGCGDLPGGIKQADGCFHKEVSGKENDGGQSSSATCKKGNFKTETGKTIEFSCGCGEVVGGVLQKDGCYHKEASVIPNGNQTECKRGFFKNSYGQEIEYSCGCGELSAGVLQADGCYHRVFH